MDDSEWAILLATGAWLCLCLGAILSDQWRARHERSVGRARQRRGRRGEARAERMLRREGYRVLDREIEGSYELLIDGEPREVRMCADFLLERDGRALIAEVKTGQRGARAEDRLTRRQVLEYFLAFEVDGVLLVEPETERIQEVCFPFASASQARPPRRRTSWLLLTAAALLLLLVARLLQA